MNRPPDPDADGRPADYVDEQDSDWIISRVETEARDPLPESVDEEDSPDGLTDRDPRTSAAGSRPLSAASR